jgi:putative ABC transport system substrate-binding protein
LLALADLVRAHVDLIVTGGTPATMAAKQATQIIPIVFGAAGRVVEKGIVRSLARPGGNVTGLQPSGRRG